MIVASLGVGFVFISCGGGTDTKATTSKRSPTPQVTMQLIAFRPSSVSIRAGSAVTWLNKDAAAHTVTSGTVEQGSGGVTAHPDQAFDSGQLPKDATFAHTFAKPGTFTYFCNNHPATMRGEVTVR